MQRFIAFLIEVANDDLRISGFNQQQAVQSLGKQMQGAPSRQSAVLTQLQPSTLTPGFRKRVADDLRAPLDVVVAHFAAAQGGTAGPQFYKADDKPNNGGRQTFEEAVRSSGLSEAQQRALLAL